MAKRMAKRRTTPSGEGCAGTPASGRSALIVVPPRPVRDDRYRLNQPTPPIRLQALTQGARTLAGRQSVGSGRWQDTYGFGHAVPPCVATRPAQIAAPGGAARPLHSPEGAMSRAVAGSQPPFTVVADYERRSAVRAAGRAGDESGRGRNLLD